jgi:excisionase family DNA binding protein
MHHRLQFGMRENPPSERRHGSRPAALTKTSSHFVRDEDPQAGSTVALSNQRFAGTHSFTSAATNSAATVERLGERNEPVSAGRRPDQAPLNTLSEIEFEPLLDVIDAAKLLRIHPKTLRAKAGRGIIPGFQIGRVWRFRASILNRWLEGMTDRGRR